jgi:hypothetical protein
MRRLSIPYYKDPNVRIMSFPTAEAFTIIFPELVRLVLPQGVIDIDQTSRPLMCHHRIHR